VFKRYLPACEAACKELVASALVEPEKPELPSDLEPDIDQPRAERLNQEHLDQAMELLRDLVIEIPWGDYDDARKRAVLDMNHDLT
jgi:hypothetical protein